MKTLMMLLFLSVAAQAKVIETNKMADAIAAADNQTLLVFDLDNTLIEPTHQLGSDQWYYFLEEKYRKIDGLNEDKAYEKAMKVWNASQSVITIKAVEKNTPDLIKKAQAKGIRTMGLTARTLDVAAKSLEQLESIGVHLEKNSPYDKDLEIAAQDLAKYTRGVLFVGDRNDKGVVLKQFLTTIKLRPAKIVFVDDKVKHVNNVEKALDGFVSYTGFRYGAADHKVKAFKADLAHLKIFFLGEVE